MKPDETSNSAKRPFSSDLLFGVKVTVLFLVFAVGGLVGLRLISSDPTGFAWKNDAWIAVLLLAGVTFTAATTLATVAGKVAVFYPPQLLGVFGGLSLMLAAAAAVISPPDTPLGKPDEVKKQEVVKVVTDAAEAKKVQQAVDALRKQMEDLTAKKDATGAAEKAARQAEIDDLKTQITRLEELLKLTAKEKEEASKTGVNLPPVALALPQPKAEEPAPTTPEQPKKGDNEVPNLPPGPQPSKGGGSDPSAFMTAFAGMLMMIAPELLPILGPLLMGFLSLGTDVKDLPPVAQATQNIVSQGTNVDVEAEMAAIRAKEWASPKPAIAALRLALKQKATQDKIGTDKAEAFDRELALLEKIWERHGDIALAIGAGGAQELCTSFPAVLEAADKDALTKFIATVPAAAVKKASPALWVQACQAYLARGEADFAVRIADGKATPFRIDPKKLSDAKKALAEAWKTANAPVAKQG